MSMDYIYTKSTSSNNFKFIAVPPHSLIQIPITNADWGRLKIGLFWSFTNSPQATAFSYADTYTSTYFNSLDGQIKSAGIGNFSFIGLTLSATDPKKPLTEGHPGFMGIAFDGISALGTSNNTIDDDYRHKLGLSHTELRYTGYTRRVDPELRVLTSTNTVIASAFSPLGISFPWPRTITPFSDDDPFAGYIGFSFTVLNKGLSNQQIQITLRLPTYQNNGLSQYNSSFSHVNNIFNNVDIDNLKVANTLDGAIENDTTEYILNWNDGLSAYPMPNSFIWYNNWPIIRPCIYSIAARF